MSDSSEVAPFRDAIAQALRRNGAHTPNTSTRWLKGDDLFHPDADAILAMSEMQAIKQALDVALECTPLGCPYLLQDGSEGCYGPNTCNQGCQEEPECITHLYPRLPASVVQWVRS